MNIAIVGATGNVGRKLLEVLQKKNFVFDNIYLIASPKSAGKKIHFKNQDHMIHDIENYDFSKAEITFLLQVQQLQRNGLQLQQKIL